MPESLEKVAKRSSARVKGPRLGEVLIAKDTIARRIHTLASEIQGSCGRSADAELMIVPIMTGSMIFVADLIRELTMPVRLAMMVVSNYPGTATTAQGVQIRYDIQEDVAGKDVLVVDDILETGQTLSAVTSLLKSRGAKSVKVCVLLEKIQNKPRCIEPDFAGFQIPDKFVVGYGLDYDNLFRNYPQIAVLEV
jgi:hypoxanthine phosphoribosyltransferase